MFQEIKKIVKALGTPLLVGLVSGLFTKDAMAMFEKAAKPPLSPPAVLFPIVWTVLYLLMGISSYIIGKAENKYREEALSLYVDQLTVNFLWPIFFFSFEWYFFAFLWLLLLWILVLRMIIVFLRISPGAAYLNIPYLLWLTFAAYLNVGIWLLN